MRFTRTAFSASVLVVAALAVLPASLSGQADRKLQVSFNSGRVTLIARNVTLRDVLTEWTRQGGCQFVNIEKLAGGLLPPLQFENEPELTVLGSLLGPVSGYIVGGRRVGTVGASQFEAVYIVATSHPTSNGFTTSGPIAAPLVSPAMPDDEIPPVTPIGAPSGQAAPPLPSGTNPGQNTPSVGGVPGTPVLVPPTGGRATLPGTTPPASGPGRGGGRGGGR